MDPQRRLERFERALEELVALNETTAVVVEGSRDAAALRELGVVGDILVYNEGHSMIEFCDRVRDRMTLICLFDWDRKGGQLTRLLQAQLGGIVKVDLERRKEFAYVSLVKCVEDLPHALRTLTKRAEEHAERFTD